MFCIVLMRWFQKWFFKNEKTSFHEKHFEKQSQPHSQTDTKSTKKKKRFPQVLATNHFILPDTKYWLLASLTGKKN
jgi:hypothetical protein